MKWRDAVQRLVLALSVDDGDEVMLVAEELQVLAAEEPLDLDEQRFFDRLNLIIEQEMA